MKIGVALSGGGVRGAAHIGVLKALHESGIPISMISGTSSGSIVASLYAAGYSPREIEKIFLRFEKGVADFDWGKLLPAVIDLFLFKRKWNREKLDLVDVDFAGIFIFIMNWLFMRKGKIDGFIKGNVIEWAIQHYCGEKGVHLIKDVSIPLAVPAIDINTAQTIMFVSDKCYFQDTKHTIHIDDAYIWEAVRASAAFPVIFKPRMFRGRRLVDGGITDNIPTKALKEMGADRILAVNLGYSGQPRDEIDNIFEIAAQSIDIMSYQLSRYRLAEADYVFKPRIYDVKLLETSRIRECIDRGYIMAKREIPEIRRTLGLNNMYVRYA